MENAQAKFGKSFEPIAQWWTKQQVLALNFFSSGLDGWAMLGEAMSDTGKEAGAFERKTLALAVAQDNAKRAGRGLNAEARDLNDNLGDVEAQTSDTSRKLDTMWRNLDHAEASARGLDGALDDLNEALFGTDIRAGELASAKKDLAELKKAGPDSKSAEDVAIYNGKLAELRQRIFDIESQQAQAAGKEAYLDFLLEQRRAIEDVNDELAIYLDKLILAAQLEGLAAIGSAGGRRASQPAPPAINAPTVIEDPELRDDGSILLPGEGRAHGGPVTGGTPYIVGEEGPELFVPQTSGTIVPNGSTFGRSSGGGMTFVYAPTYSTASPAEAQRFASAVGPDIIRWARSAGVAV